MKILFLSDDFPPTSFGGAGISTYELASGVKKAGHEVFVITTCRSKEDSGESTYNGLKIFKIPSNYSNKWRTYRSLHNYPVTKEVGRILKNIQPDVVHSNNIHFHLSYYSLKLAKKYSKAVVFTARDTMSICSGKLGTQRYLNNFDYHTTWIDNIKYAKKRWNPFHNMIVRRYFNYVDRIFTVSESLMNALIQNGISRAETLHTGADASLWSVEKNEGVNFRNTHNLKDKKIILFGGRLGEAKGAEKIIEALVSIVKEVPDALLMVVGDVDWYAEKMKEKAESLGVGDKLFFTGWIERENISKAYSAANIVIVPSLYLDPFPRIVIEAMASSRAVVGTCYGGASEIIDNGVTGYVINPLHVEEIVEKVLLLLSNSKKAEEFGAAGRTRIENDFNLSDKVNEYIVAYESLITKNGN